jgi:hypothetical protein
VEAAIQRHDPAEATRRAEVAAENRGVWVDDRIDGTSILTAITDTPHAVAFDTALDTVAATLSALGDTDPHQVRRAKAVGVLADPQTALDLHTHRADTNHASGSDVAGAGDGSSGGNRGSGGDSWSSPTRKTGPGAALVHIHLHTTALTALTALTGLETGHGALEPVARVDGLGPRPTTAITRWLGDLAPGAVIKVTPVVDLAEHIAVDAYEAPDRLRRLVEERDHTCVFPWCGRRGRYDLDHITPYLPLDHGGPPGQTSDHNTARLCRFHHRVKTHSAWRYTRTPHGDLTWTSPLGWRYSVDENGTRPLTTPPPTD